MLTKVISNKALGFDKERVLEIVMSNKDSEHLLYRVFGIIEGHEIGKGRFQRVNAETGEAENTTWTKFFGEFRAMTSDGKVFEAATCFLPSYVQGQFVSELIGDGSAEISFAYDIYAVYSKGSATSYEFLAQPVKKEGEADRLAELTKSMVALPSAQTKAIEQKKK